MTKFVIPEPPRDLNRSHIRYLSWKEDGKLVHGPASNFYIEPDGTHVEGEFQGSKETNPFTRKLAIAHFLELPPGQAKKLGRKLDLRKDWEKVKIDVMRRLVTKKFNDHPVLMDWLDSTGQKLIFETNYWHDNFWGNCACIQCNKIGTNYLGKILMGIRYVNRGGTESDKAFIR